MTPVKPFDPDAFLGTHGFPDLGPFTHCFLAQGDSWFSIGAAVAIKTTNILMEMELEAASCAVNCASPGATLRRMEDTIRAPKFRNLLAGAQAWPWDGILMSAGGNDLIDAVQVLPRYGDASPLAGRRIPAKLRILLRDDEWGPGTTADRYLSDAGWTTFCDHLRQLFVQLEAIRDGHGSRSVGVPVFVHCYDHLLARPAGAGLHTGPWLYPAVKAYKIPEADWAALGVVLIDRLRDLLRSIQMPNLHVVDTTPGTLDPATSPTGSSGDWVNEIHPTRKGYRKIAAKYAAVVDSTMP